ncbi:hypothetical protein L249_1235 [Ophiocordyceps polyrhachis-furcata BCC 54312]|uniref:SET domain-containing protein n=1 Tax=Ophiocordyceps polyrhachis-furcata BCC 54312 TaxID=1330021 RepID=A0A367LDZ2_9HYPO|nr:hypothetical protein L249_1235 [Ophiocordyceps polyrhachis-furcata BCC 54312]
MADDQIESLLAWATRQGALIHPSVQVYRSPATGLSLRVKPTVAAGPDPSEAILRVPTSLTLSYLDASSPTSSFPPELAAGLPPHVVGRLLLIRQYLLGPSSFWWPYIQALPQPKQADQSWRLPPFWPPDDVDLLDGTNVGVGAAQIRQDVAAELTLARELLRHQDGQDAVALAEALRAPDLYHWAYCIFSSRSFRPALVLSPSSHQHSLLAERGASLDDFSVLFPLFDIANHDMTAHVEWRLDDKFSQSCELRVHRLHAPGAQIFNNYSLKTNAELLLGYGFILPVTDEVHNDYVHVRKRGTATSDYLISLRPLAQPSSLLVRSRDRQSPCKSDDGVLGAFRHVQPDLVWDIFCTMAPLERLARLIPTQEDEGDDNKDFEYERRRRFLTGRVAGDCRPYLEQTMALVQHKVVLELERLNETDLEVVGADVDLLSRNQRLALDYRARCRRVLENTIEAMEGFAVDDEE